MKRNITQEQFMPEISVNIPAYNAGKYIEPCLNSILTYQEDLEVLVLDDGSTDNTASIIRKISGKDPRVKLLQFGKQQGVAAGRQKLLESSQGKYILPFDADDLMLPGWISTAKAYFKENPHVDAIYGKCRFMSNDEIPLPKTIGSTYSRINCYVCHPVPQGAVLAKRELFLKVGGYMRSSEKGACVMEDFFTWCRMMLHSEMVFIDSFAFLYRDHEQQMTKKLHLFKDAMSYIQNYLINQNKELTNSLLQGTAEVPESQFDRNLAVFVIGALIKSLQMPSNQVKYLLDLAEKIDPDDYGVYIKRYEFFKAIGRTRAAVGAAKSLINFQGEDYYPRMMGHFLMTDYYKSIGDRESFDIHEKEYTKYFDSYTDLEKAFLSEEQFA